MPSAVPSANWAITGSLTSSCGFSTPGCSGSVCPCAPRRLRASRPSTIRPSTKSLPDGRMMARSGRRLWLECGILGRGETARHQWAPMADWRSTVKKGGMASATRATKTRRARKSSGSYDNHGYVLAPVPVAPVNETDMVLFPEGLKALKKVAKEVDLDLRGAYLNLDGGFDSAHNRKCIFNAGLIPNIKENPPTARRRSGAANGSSTPLSMRYGCGSNGPLRGRTSSSDYCSVLNASSSGTMA